MMHTQVYIGKGKVDSFSLIADMLYVGDNAPRIARALFEIALRNQWVALVHDLLMVRLLNIAVKPLPRRSFAAAACYPFS
jgi:Sec63 Brl domain